jgi:hypothetical protein
MGKDLHYSIRPFIERALSNHRAVKDIEELKVDDFYAYRVKRNFAMTDVIIVLSDDYNFNDYSYQNKPSILKDGGFFLVAKPEAHCIERNEPADRIVVGKIGRILGALNKNEFWTYEPPKKEEEN